MQNIGLEIFASSGTRLKESHGTPNGRHFRATTKGYNCIKNVTISGAQGTRRVDQSAAASGTLSGGSPLKGPSLTESLAMRMRLATASIVSATAFTVPAIVLAGSTRDFLKTPAEFRYAP